MRETTREVDTSSLSKKWRKRSRKVPKAPITETHPEVAAQWHPRKNKEIGPTDLTYGSNVKVWWLCQVHRSHEWEAQVNSRCAKNGEQRHGCPFCSGNKTCVTNSLASLFPKIADEWHPRKNKELSPAAVTGGSNRNVWWQCLKNKTHVWQCVVGWRTADDTGCPFCSNSRVSKTNSLKAMFPKMATEWHATKNGNLTALDIVPGSHKMVWWQCKKESSHEWQTTPKSRVADNTRCPFCIGRRPSTFNNLLECFPQIAAEWHPTKNGKRTPSSMVPGSNLRVCWRCSVNKNHIWEAKIVSRTRSLSGCPFCAAANKTPRRKSSVDSVAKLFPKLAKEWHAQQNGDLTPSDVTPGSNKKIWWQCRKNDKHIWRTTVVARTTRKTGCPYCAGKKVSETNCLLSLYPEIAAEWHPSRNGKLTPAQVARGTNKLAWWRCHNNSRHIWQVSVVKRTGRGQGCPECTYAKSR